VLGASQLHDGAGKPGLPPAAGASAGRTQARQDQDWIAWPLNKPSGARPVGALLRDLVLRAPAAN